MVCSQQLRVDTDRMTVVGISSVSQVPNTKNRLINKVNLSSHQKHIIISGNKDGYYVSEIEF